MKNFRIKAFVVWFAPFFLVATYLLVRGFIDSLAYLVIIACSFLVQLFCSKDVEEINFKGFTLIKRFKSQYDEQERSRIECYVNKKVAESVQFNEGAAKERISALVRQGHGTQDSIILGLLKRVQELERQQVALRPQVVHPDLSRNPCQIHGTRYLCRNSTGIFCECCQDYVCVYQGSFS